jgi:hypothetical protein
VVVQSGSNATALLTNANATVTEATLTQLGCKAVLMCHLHEHRLDSPHFLGVMALMVVLVMLSLIVAIEPPVTRPAVVEHQLHVRAARKVQARFRVYLAKRFIRQRKMYKAWESKAWIAAGATALIWLLLLSYIVFMFYINLLYGVKFDSEQAQWWIIASFAGMLIDVCVQEPIVTSLSVLKFDQGIQDLWAALGLDAFFECFLGVIGLA